MAPIATERNSALPSTATTKDTARNKKAKLADGDSIMTPAVATATKTNADTTSAVSQYTLPNGKKLPVTLLSGFLGSGKTTLLERILTSNHGYRIGVIVNDMGALNIDAALLANHKVSQSEERVVEMQNGCICCTLRGDLLEEVARLAMDGNVDYLVIESSGISEPMQVAETFSAEFAEMHMAAGKDLEQEMAGDADSARQNAKVAEILKAGGLSIMSRLDCCVTMVDAVNFFNDFETADFLVDRHGKDDVPEEDDRNISDLQVDQLEFANVVIVNKCDLVSQQEIERILTVVKTLNPAANIVTATRAQINVKDILDTKRFSYEEAAMGAGWLRSLREEVKPETEEYGIGSFVYRARRPFHPERLWQTIKNVFVVIQEEYIDDGVEEDDDEDDEDADADKSDGSDGEMNDDPNGSAESDEDDQDEDEERQPQLNPKARLAAKKADKTFAPLLRSKGFLWLATRPDMFGEWSQAGVMLTVRGGDSWRAEVPESEWPDDAEIRKAIREDFQGKWGDRRQELVFIGTNMSKQSNKDDKETGQMRLQKAMDDCLLTDEEWAQCQEVMGDDSLSADEKKDQLSDLFFDGFEAWNVEDDEHDHDAEDDDDKDGGAAANGHSAHNGHSHKHNHKHAHKH